jgi:hypothetical protein
MLMGRIATASERRNKMMRTPLRIWIMTIIGCILLINSAYAVGPRYWNAPPLHAMPKRHHMVWHNRHNYIYHEGRYYHHGHGHFYLVAPPIGLVVPFLPPFGVATVVIGGYTYYEANGVYYRRVPGGYTVIEEPMQPPAEGESPVFVQPVPTQEKQYYWYYCRHPEGYYPYVKQCPEGWMKVVPNPTPPDAGKEPPDIKRR